VHLPKSSLLSVDRFTAALLAWKFICGHNQLACEFDIRPHRRPPHTRGSTVQKPAHLMHRYYFALLRIRFRQNTRPQPAHTTGHRVSKLVSGSPATPVLDLMTGNCRRPGTHPPATCVHYEAGLGQMSCAVSCHQPTHSSGRPRLPLPQARLSSNSAWPSPVGV